MNKALLSLAMIAALCSCGGGSASGGGSGSAGGGSITPSQPGSGSEDAATATLTLRFPVSNSAAIVKKHPAYVSGNATQLVVVVNSVNGSATLPAHVQASTTVALSTTGSSPNCTITGGVETCTAAFPAPPGSVNYTFDLEDSSDDVLATATQTFTIASGVANSLTLTLGGVVATVAVTGPTLTPGASATTALTVTAKDASGYTIGGTAAFSNPFVLAISDTSGATALSLNGGTAAASVTVNAPTDTVSVVYSGEATGNATISTTTSNVSGGGTLTANAGSITFPSGTAIDSTANGGSVSDPNYGQPTVYFYATGSQAAFTAAEAGWTNAPFNQALTTTFDSTTCGSGGSAVASLVSNVESAGTDTITVAGNAAGFCKVTLSDGLSASATVWISVTAGSFTINTHHAHQN